MSFHSDPKIQAVSTYWAELDGGLNGGEAWRCNCGAMDCGPSHDYTPNGGEANQLPETRCEDCAIPIPDPGENPDPDALLCDRCEAEENIRRAR